MNLSISNFQTIDYFLKTIQNDYFKSANLKIAFEYKGHICTGNFLILNNNRVQKERIVAREDRCVTSTGRNSNIREIIDLTDIPSDSKNKELYSNLDIVTRTSKNINLLQQCLLQLVEKITSNNNLPKVIYNLKCLDSPSVPVFPLVNVSDDEIKFISIFPTEHDVKE